MHAGCDFKKRRSHSFALAAARGKALVVHYQRSTGGFSHSRKNMTRESPHAIVEPVFKSMSEYKQYTENLAKTLRTLAYQ